MSFMNEIVSAFIQMNQKTHFPLSGPIGDRDSLTDAVKKNVYDVVDHELD